MIAARLVPVAYAVAVREERDQHRHDHRSAADSEKSAERTGYSSDCG